MPVLTTPNEWNLVIEDYPELLAGGLQVRDLVVKVNGDVVRIGGTVSSWHDKQRLSETARGLFSRRQVINDVTVVKRR